MTKAQAVPGTPVRTISPHLSQQIEGVISNRWPGRESVDGDGWEVAVKGSYVCYVPIRDLVPCEPS
jgi:hypothetical protein